jgi:hypothetical protein
MPRGGLQVLPVARVAEVPLHAGQDRLPAVTTCDLADLDLGRPTLAEGEMRRAVAAAARAGPISVTASPGGTLALEPLLLGERSALPRAVSWE